LGIGEGRRPAAVILALGFVASLIVNFPGHFTPDSVWQLAQGRAGLFNDWHPPIMAWLLGLADRATPGAWSFILGEAVLFYGAMFALVALEPRPRSACLPLLLVWIVSPVVLIYQGIALKDVLFADLALAAFASLAWAAKMWARRGVRAGLLALSLSFFVLASLTRQNGFIAPLFGAVAFGAIQVTRRPSSSWTRRARAAVGAMIIAVGLVGALDSLATAALRARSADAPQGAHHLKVLEVFDLAGALHTDPALALASLRTEDPELARFLRQSAAPNYRTSGADYLSYLPRGADLLESPGRAADKAWTGLILDRPWLYLGLRSRVWRDTFLTPAAGACPMIMTGVDATEPMLRAAGLGARRNAKDDWDNDFAAAFFPTPLYAHAFYAALILLGLGLGLGRRLRGDKSADLIVTLALGVAGLAFAASFFVLSIGCDYRFLYFLDVAAMALVTREAAARRAPPQSAT
jgi:hypothetical protein